MAIEISAFKGRDNVDQIEFMRNSQPVNFAEEGVTSIKATAGGQLVDATFNGNIVNVKFGELNLRTGKYQAQILVFTDEKPNGEVIAGPGKDIEIELSFNG